MTFQPPLNDHPTDRATTVIGNHHRRHQEPRLIQSLQEIELPSKRFRRSPAPSNRYRFISELAKPDLVAMALRHPLNENKSGPGRRIEHEIKIPKTCHRRTPAQLTGTLSAQHYTEQLSGSATERDGRTY